MVGARLWRALENIYPGDEMPGYIDFIYGALPYCRDEAIHDLARTDACQESIVPSFREPLLADIESEEHQIQPRSDHGVSMSLRLPGCSCHSDLWCVHVERRG